MPLPVARSMWVLLLLSALSLGGCAAPAGDTAPPAAGMTAVPQGVTRAEPVVVVAVGDIACAPGAPRTPVQCQHRRTARLAERLSPDALLTLGDQQYERGGLRAFRRSYGDTWGALRARTYPVPGNHEYRTSGASGYYAYFSSRQPGPPGYYAVDLGAWRVYLLNSNCGVVDCAAERAWLTADLVAHPARCAAFAAHHPRFSSGEHGSQQFMAPFFRIAYRHRVELFLSGHDHHAERFAPLAPDGTRSPRGVVQLVSGAGGKSLYPLEGVTPGSAYRLADRFGVRRLVLGADGYRTSFRGIDGSIRDVTARDCR